MPNTVPHLGVLDGDDDPLGIVQDMPVLPCSGWETDVTRLGFNRLTVGVGLEMTCIVLRAILFVTDLVTVRIVHFTFHVTPHIDDLPNAATPSKSYYA